MGLTLVPELCAGKPAGPAEGQISTVGRRKALSPKWPDGSRSSPARAAAFALPSPSFWAQEGAKVVCAARTLNEGDHPLKGSLRRHRGGHPGGGRRSDADRGRHIVGGRVPDDSSRRRAPGLRPDRHAGEQRRAQLLHSDGGLSDQPLDQGLRHQRPCAVHPGQGRAARHDRSQRRGAIVNIGSGWRSGPGAAPMPIRPCAAA